MSDGDWLAGARDAFDAALEAGTSADQARLLTISQAQAGIAIAEALRALVGAIAAVPTFDFGEEPDGGHQRAEPAGSAQQP